MSANRVESGGQPLGPMVLGEALPAGRPQLDCLESCSQVLGWPLNPLPCKASESQPHQALEPKVGQTTPPVSGTRRPHGLSPSGKESSNEKAGWAAKALGSGNRGKSPPWCPTRVWGNTIPWLNYSFHLENGVDGTYPFVREIIVLSSCLAEETEQ